MKSNFSILCLIFLSSSLFAQTTFKKTYELSNYSNSLAAIPGGGAVIYGDIANNDSTRFSVVKVDSLGNVVFADAYQGAWFMNVKPSVQLNGEILIGINNPQSVSDDSSGCLMKLDVAGNPSWTKRYFADSETLIINKILATNDGGYLIAAGGYIYFKINSEGAIEWSRKFIEPSQWYYSFSNFTALTQIDDGYLMGRWYDGDDDFSLEIIRIDNAGNVIWTDIEYLQFYKAYEMTLAVMHDKVYACFSFVWQEGNSEEYAGGFLQKFDMNGVLLENHPFGITGIGISTQVHDCIQQNDHAFLVSCITYYPYNFSPLPNSFIFSVDTAANILWSKIYSDSAILQLDADTTGNIYSIQGSAGAYFNSPGEHFVLSKVKSNGDGLCSAIDSTQQITSSPVWYLDVPASIPDTVILSFQNLTISYYTLPVSVADECFTSSTFPLPADDDIYIYPNPADDHLSIKINNKNESCSYDIYDVMGHKVASNIFRTTYEKEIETKNLAQGIYLLKLTVGEKIFNKKIVIEH